jgi:hypothetical protein
MTRKLCAAIVASILLGVASAPPASAQSIDQIVAQRAQLVSQFEACRAQLAAFNQQQALAASQGMLLQPPPCFNYLEQWTAQIAYLEQLIYRAQGGDRTLCERMGRGPNCERN